MRFHLHPTQVHTIAADGTEISISENYQKYIRTIGQNRIQFEPETGKSQMNETKESNAQEQYQYDPNNLLESLIEKLNLKNDAALSRALEVAPPLISKIRHRRLPVGASLLIRMHEVSDLSIRDLRHLMGDRRTKFRISDKQFKPKAPAANTTSSTS
jgi:plasmid maintenance system antidote protein VapI